MSNIYSKLLDNQKVCLRTGKSIFKYLTKLEIFKFYQTDKCSYCKKN